MKIYSDGADLASIIAAQEDVRIAGVTTNPSLARKAGIADYFSFCVSAALLTNKPISFEVISDDIAEMERQARKLSCVAANIYVKVPITNTNGESCAPLIEKLSGYGIKVNVTAVFTPKQIMAAASVLHGAPAILSIFAGRIADTGVDPMPLCRLARKYCTLNVDILWASTRELYNIKQAEECGCDVITIAPDMLAKLHLFGYDLEKYSLDTVKQFFADAQASNFVL